MSTMRAAVCVEPGKMALEERPIPKPAADEVIVRVEASGVCGSDVRGFHGTHPEIEHYPIILGHEFAGTVVELGTDVAAPAVGTRVTVEPLAVCGVCRGCVRGTYQLCNSLKLNGHHYEGSFAEYTTAKARFCYPIPTEMDMETAAFGEPVAVAVHAVKRAQVALGDFVVILGAGPIGNLCMQVAKAAGARTLITDVDSRKLTVAKKTGADLTANATSEPVRELVLALSNGDGADVVLECAGAAATLGESVHLARKGGTVVAVGFTAAETDAVSLTTVTIRELNLLGTVIYAWDFPATVDLLATGAVRTKPLTTHRYSLETFVEQADTIAAKPRGMIKPMVLPQKS